MDLRTANDSESRFSGYVEGLVSVIGHADRAGPLRDYCVGLMLPCERKSVEPMAAVTAPERTAAQHQSLLHFVGNAGWSDEKVLAKVSEMVLPRLSVTGRLKRGLSRATVDVSAQLQELQDSRSSVRSYKHQSGSDRSGRISRREDGMTRMHVTFR